MANINVNDLDGLNPTGADLFDDPESFMVELGEDENGSILGGMPCIQPTGCEVTIMCIRATKVPVQGFV